MESSEGTSFALTGEEKVVRRDHRLARADRAARDRPVERSADLLQRNTLHGSRPEIDDSSAVLKDGTVLSVSDDRISNCHSDGWLDKTFEITSVPPNFAEELGTSWFDLGLQLNIKRTALSNIEDENKYNRDKVHAVIAKWQMQQGKDATTRVLGNALLKIKRKDVADNLGVTPKQVLNLQVEEVFTFDTSSRSKSFFCQDQRTNKKYLVRELDSDIFDVKEHTGEQEIIDDFLAEFKKRCTSKKAKEAKIAQRLSVDLESLEKELEQVASEDIRYLQRIDYSASTRLSICSNVNDMFQRMFISLRDLVGDLGECDNNGLVEKVHRFTKSVRSEYDFVGGQVQQLEEKKEDFKKEEMEEFTTLKKMENRQRTQMEQLDKLFGTIFKQKAYRKSVKGLSPYLPQARSSDSPYDFFNKGYSSEKNKSTKRSHRRRASSSSGGKPSEPCAISEPLFVGSMRPCVNRTRAEANWRTEGTTSTYI